MKILTKDELAKLKWKLRKESNVRTNSLLPEGSCSQIDVVTKPEGKYGVYKSTNRVFLVFGEKSEYTKEWKSELNLIDTKKQVLEVVEALIDAGAEFYIVK